MRSLFWAVLVLFSGHCVGQASDPFQDAANKTDIFSSGKFHLQGTVKYSFMKTVTGEYTLDYLDQENWKDSVTLGSFQQVRVAHAGMVSTSRTHTLLPYPIDELEKLLNWNARLRLDPVEEAVAKNRSKTVDGVKATCFELKWLKEKRPGGELCLSQADGVYIGDPEKTGTRYADFRTFGPHLVPYKMRFADSRSDLSLQISELSQFSGTLPSSIENTTPVFGCFNPVPERLENKLPPHYPADAMMRRVNGTVDLYAVIDASGNVTNLKVIDEPDRSLGASSIAAVQQWKYKPATCAGKPVSEERVIVVNFNMSY